MDKSYPQKSKTMAITNNRKTTKDYITKENIINYLELKKYSDELTKIQKRLLRRKAEGLKYIDGKLYKQVGVAIKNFFILSVDKPEMVDFIKKYTKKNHSRDDKTFAIVHASAVGITRDFVREVLNKCTECQISNKMQTY